MLSLAVLCAAAACGSDSTGTIIPPVIVVTTSVTMQNIAFAPARIQVSPGAVVTWTNNDNIQHTVTFDGTVGAIAAFSTGAKTLTMPTTAGTYEYHCTIHAGMAGTVIVQ
jgi:plastocyanin